jgi:hypothetical protein
VTWRDRACPIIRDVLAEVGREDMRALRRALLVAYRTRYHGGECRYWPYKVWRSEVRAQVGTMGPPRDRWTLPLPFEARA